MLRSWKVKIPEWTWFKADKRILWHRPGEHAAIEKEVRQFLDRA